MNLLNDVIHLVTGQRPGQPVAHPPVPQQAQQPHPLLTPALQQAQARPVQPALPPQRMNPHVGSGDYQDPLIYDMNSPMHFDLSKAIYNYPATLAQGGKDIVTAPVHAVQGIGHLLGRL